MSLVRATGELLFGDDVEGFGPRWRVWSARRASTTPSSDLIMGQRAKVVGIARPVEHVLTAPFTKRPALAYRTKLLEKSVDVTSEGRQYVTWKLAFSDAFGVPFLLEDERGSVVVDGSNGIFAVGEENVNEHPHVNDENPELRALLRSRGILSTLYMGIAGEHRFLEAILRPGDRVGVWGTVSEAAGVVSAGYRDASTRTKKIAGATTDVCVVLRP